MCSICKTDDDSVPCRSCNLKYKPHIHAAVIKAWADGADVQFKHPKKEEWTTATGEALSWLPHMEYRVKPEPHKFQSLIDACLAGATDIQVLAEDGDWHQFEKKQIPYMDANWELRRAHKWQKEMDAWEAGKTIQKGDLPPSAPRWGNWTRPNEPDWDNPFKIFRIKPEEMRQKYWLGQQGCAVVQPPHGISFTANVEATFVGGELSKLEIIKS